MTFKISKKIYPGIKKGHPRLINEHVLIYTQDKVDLQSDWSVHKEQ